jgi:Small secreted domain (DUF320).
MNAPKKVAAVTFATVGLIAAGAGSAMASSHAEGSAIGSPGAVSGNVIQVPVSVPVNVCGNTVNVLIAALNPAFGNVCINS